MKDSIKKSAAKIAIVVYILILLSTFIMPAAQGSFVLIFGILCLFALVPIITGSKNIKIVGVVLLISAVSLLINDYVKGKNQETLFRKNIEEKIDSRNLRE